MKHVAFPGDSRGRPAAGDTGAVASLPALSLGLLLFLTVAVAPAKTICVNAAATGANDGTCWTGAFTSLQSALTAAVSGDEIWVAQATYKPSAPAGRSATFALKNGVGLYGGFIGTETLRTQRDPVAHVTTLTGDIGTPGVATDNSYHVVSADVTVTLTAVLDGFTITAGNADGSAPDDRGGGMSVTGGKPTLSHCIFTGNTATEKGGGLRVTNGMPAIDTCVFRFNTALTGGGGIGAGSGSVFTVKNTVFLGNSTPDTAGGGLESFDGVTVINCAFNGNVGNGLLFLSDGFIADSTFTGNGSYGVAFDVSGTVVNSILWGDAIDEVFVGFGTISISYSDVGGSGFGGTGNKFVDPLFVNPAGGDLRLGPGSPAVDAGRNASVPVGTTTDANGLPRFFDDPAVPDTGSGTAPIVDMGAYERVPLSVTAPAPVTVCAGASAGFSVTASGQSPFTYRWRRNGANLSDGGSISGALTASLTINPSATGDAGSYDVVVKDTFGQAVTSASAALVVNPMPSAPVATNSGPVCAGSTLQLTASTVAGATYSWTGPNGFTSAIQNPSIASATVAASGIYTVHATVNGCVSSAATTTATVQAVPPAPTAGNGGPVCAGQDLHLTATTVPGATYAWTGPSGFTSTQQNPVILAAPASASGTYSVTATVSGCASAPAMTTAVVHALPSAAISAASSACAGSTGHAASVASAGAGATYAWSITNGTITAGAGTTAIVFTAGATGSVSLSVLVTDSNGCAANGSKSVAISALCLSYYTVAPCRIVDTRGPAGPYGSPALAAGADRTFAIVGQCGIPASARAVSLNVAVTAATAGPGFLTLFPGGTTRPLASTINYAAGATRANNAIVPLGVSGDVVIHCGQGSGTAQAIVDVDGYFQ